MRIHGFSDRPEAVTRYFMVQCALGVALAATTLAGCNSNPAATNPADGTTAANPSDPNGQDPTLANMAPVEQAGTPVNSTQQGPTQVAGYQQQAQPTQQSYSNAAPIERRAPSSSGQSSQYPDQGYNQGSSDPNYSGQNYNDDYDAETGYNATLADVSAPEPPPPLPVYEQPEAPDPNYLWTPGYWSYAPQGYYWVPGAWAQPPYTGALWTPGYWGGYGSGYRFHRGFWASHIGFYGGINYGFGYFGSGYQGGYWNGDNFYYNRECNRVNDRVIRNVYQRNVVINNTVINNTTINNRTVNNVSYNGGRGGVQVRPRPAELAVLREQRVAPMQGQVQHQQQAEQNRQQFFSQNRGRPTIVAATQPLRADRGIVAPAHTTAQINRALPVAQQIRQEQQFVRPATPNPAARPTNQPNVVQQNRIAPNQQQNRPQPIQQPMQQNRPGITTQQNRPGQPGGNVRPGQPENRPNQPQVQNRPVPQQPVRPVTPQQQARPLQQQQQQTMRPQQAQQQVRPVPQQQVRPVPQQQPRPVPQQPVRPQPEARPQTQPQTVRPQPQQQIRPQPEARPQVQQPRPQPQVQQPRPQPQMQQPRPQVQQARPAAPAPHPQGHPEQPHEHR